MAAWADDEEIVCVHPGGQRVIGPMAVRASYEAILAAGGVAAVPEQVRRLQGTGLPCTIWSSACAWPPRKARARPS
ncbi:hypothetical protein MASR1M6_04320 [Rubrivivax sp.]